jgi:hypothetical protein
VREDDVADYFALLGSSWASIQPRVNNEYTVTAAHPPMADPHVMLAAAAAAAATPKAAVAVGASKSVTFAVENPVATTPAETAALAKVTDALKKIVTK